MSKPDTDAIQGCSDGGCIFGHTGGMHTNGGCRCLRDLRPTMERIRITRNIMELRAEIRRLREVVPTLVRALELPASGEASEEEQHGRVE